MKIIQKNTPATFHEKYIQYTIQWDHTNDRSF